jgi:hypothetical protein
LLTFERAHERLIYDDKTGLLTWKIDHWKTVKAGRLAGDFYRNGYRRVCVDSKDYLAHRVVWLMIHGEWPDCEIDHINGDRTDNRIENLRLATSAQNKQNVGLKSSNRSGFTGVSWFKACKCWRADITLNGKAIYLGRFDTPEAAAEAYAKAKAELHTFNPVARAA